MVNAINILAVGKVAVGQTIWEWNDTKLNTILLNSQIGVLLLVPSCVIFALPQRAN